MLALGFATIALYVGLVIVWLALEKRHHRARLWVAFAAIAAAGPFFMVLGAFLGTLSSNICYSEVIGIVADLPSSYVRSGNIVGLAELGKLQSKLPLHGYETSCEEVRAVVQSLK
jgi:hypothetical protein